MIDINQNEASSLRQRDLILAYLKAGKTLTALEALDMFGCFRLSARIKELKDDGHMIMTRMILTKHSRKRVAEYTLLGE